MIKVQSRVVITMNAPIWCDVNMANYLLVQGYLSAGIAPRSEYNRLNSRYIR